jgi:hypothetical protein
MLNTIVSLDPNGDGADYEDGVVGAVLSSSSLTTAGRTTLKLVLTRSRQARAIVTAAFGGGE